MKKFLFLIPFLAMLLAACGGLSQSEVYRVETQSAQGTPLPPKYQTAAAVSFRLTPTATITPLPTITKVTVIDYASTMAANEMISLITKQAGEVDAERARQAAEEAQLKAKQEEINATERAGNLNATITADARTAQAYYNMLTAQESDSRTAAAVVVHNQETAVAAQETKRVQPTADMWTGTAVQQEIDIKQGEVQDVNLAVQRQTWKNFFDAMLPWTLTVCLAYVAARGFQTYMKNRAHERDKHGRSPTLQRELTDGSTVYVKPDQMETAIVKVTRDGEIVRYAPIDDEEQSRINRGNSIADIVGQLPIPYAQAGKDLLGKFAGGQGNQQRIFVHGDGSFGDVIEEADSRMIEEEV